MNTFYDLDIDRKSEILVLLEISKLAFRELEKLSGINAVTWGDQFSEKAENIISDLPERRIEASIGHIEDNYLGGESRGLSNFLLDSIREKANV